MLSLPIPTMNYWSRSYPETNSCIMVTDALPKRVFVERSTYCWKLYTWSTHRQRLVWQGVSCISQTHQWIEGFPHDLILAQSLKSARWSSNRQRKTMPTSPARSTIIGNFCIRILLDCTRSSSPRIWCG